MYYVFVEKNKTPKRRCRRRTHVARHVAATADNRLNTSIILLYYYVTLEPVSSTQSFIIINILT